MADRIIIQGDNSTYNQIHNYGEKKIRRHLTPPPFLPEVFLGREEELGIIHEKLFSKKNILLLVNGEGGVGKTSLAATYYHRYQHEYKHVAWVLSEKNVTTAILRLDLSLGVEFEPTSTPEERLPLILQAMVCLDKPCLLVIDNANELDDLEKNYQHLRSIPNFHLLLTTRVTEFHKADLYKIEGLPFDRALELFKEFHVKYDSSEDQVFEQIYEAVWGNTLVIELMSKNLHLLNQLPPKYRLSDLLRELKEKGLLFFSQMPELASDYKNEGEWKRRKINEIVAAMYDLGDLSENEQALMSVFSVLPPESIQFKWLEQLIPSDTLEATLQSLAQKGWINYEASSTSFKPSPVVQAVTRFKNKERLNRDCESLARHLQSKLLEDATSGEFEKSNYQDAIYYAYLAESLIIPLELAENMTSMVGEKLGNYKRNLGDFHGALAHYQRNYNFKKQFIKQFPDVLLLKNGLRSACKNLREIYLALGDFVNALHYAEESYNLEMEFFQSQPDNVGYKLNLAAACVHLGETHTKLTQLGKASVCFEESAQYFEELSNSDPNEIVFQDGIAIVLFKLGETYTAMGHHQRAYLYHVACNRVGNNILKAFPADENFKKRLATSYEELGGTIAKLGDMNNAINCIKEWYRLENELHLSFPNDVGYKLNLARSSGHLGECYATLGQFEKAALYFEECSRHFKAISDSQADNKKSLNGLAIAYFQLGDTYTSMGDLHSAYTYYDACNRIGNILLKSFPTDLALKNRQVTSYESLAKTLLDLGDVQKALICFEDCNHLLTELHKDFPTDVKIKKGLAFSHSNLGSIYSTLGDWKRAMSYVEEFSRTIKELHDSFPQDLSFKMHLAASYCTLGEINARFDVSKSIDYFDLFYKVAHEHHADFPNDVSFKETLAVSCWKLGILLKVIKEVEFSTPFLTEAEKLWEELALSDPTHLGFQKSLDTVRLELKDMKN